jgi:BirA family transcriptional regulator, biotin operon repressor / biotin---[acetyl-CoA-carboxylase] ligase
LLAKITFFHLIFAFNSELTYNMSCLIIGSTIVELEETESTNLYSTSLIAANKAFEGTVVIAKEQKNGRGQRGSNWYSEPGKNITCSIILKPGFLDISRQFMLNKMASLAVHDVLMKFLPHSEAKIKWPNDVYVGNKKIAGILIENVLRGNRIAYSTIGLGININQELFPDGLNATSVKTESGNRTEMIVFLQELFHSMEKRYLELRSSFYALDKFYLELLYQKDEECHYKINGRETSAILRGVDENGFLLLEENGITDKHDLKEVEFIHT